MSAQLALGIRLHDGARFENFLPGANAAAVHEVAEGMEPFVYLWGADASGRSHLLQAACHAAAGEQRPAAYLPLAGPDPLVPEVLEGLEGMALVALDDLHAVAGERSWELALFHFYNRAREAGCRVLVAADVPPAELPITLPDLSSRFGWGPTWRLQPLDDEAKCQALQMRARGRGLEMPDEVARYLLRHTSRDLHALFETLEQLDKASLAAQRRLTIPFVREQLAGSGD